MKKLKILIRFDDICPTMNWEEWKKAEEILEKYNIKPLLGIIPDCKDPELLIDSPKEGYWEYIHELKKRGYIFAMHGYQHLYDNKCRGMVNNGYNTEFAGHPYSIQLEKIQYGKRILAEHELDTDIFFAPSHSYDFNTLKALSKCGFKYISDGKSIKPITRYGIHCIPCRVGGVPIIRKFGHYTAVFHAHEWVRAEKKVGLYYLNEICKRYSEHIVDFYEFANSYNEGNQLVQKIIEKIFVIYRRYMHPKLSKIKYLLIKLIHCVNL